MSQENHVNESIINEDVKEFVTYFHFENANIDTGYRGYHNNYPVFTTKEKCIQWLRG